MRPFDTVGSELTMVIAGIERCREVLLLLSVGSVLRVELFAENVVLIAAKCERQ